MHLLRYQKAFVEEEIWLNRPLSMGLGYISFLVLIMVLFYKPLIGLPWHVAMPPSDSCLVPGYKYMFHWLQLREPSPPVSLWQSLGVKGARAPELQSRSHLHRTMNTRDLWEPGGRSNPGVRGSSTSSQGSSPTRCSRSPQHLPGEEAW